jgi:dihydrofolate reductase
MNLTPDQWFYGNLRIIVLSNTLTEAPDNLKDKIELYSGDILDLLSSLENSGHKHAYIDGGATIQSFINLELINEITVTRAPLLLGEGIPLFGKMLKPLKLTHAQATCFENDFIQVKYSINYE